VPSVSLYIVRLTQWRRRCRFRVSASIFRFLWISLLHNVVKRAPILLSNGKQGLFLWGYSVRGVKLATYFYLVLSSKKVWSYIPLPEHAFVVWCSVKAQGLYLYLTLLYFTLLFFSFQLSFYCCFYIAVNFGHPYPVGTSGSLQGGKAVGS
jgi:hypothetical protein